MVVHEQDPFNAEPPLAAMAGEPLTPVDAFYSRNHGPIQVLDPQTWCLRVGGLVDRPLTLTLAGLRAAGRARTLAATLQCAGNRRAGLIAVRDIPGEDPWRDGATSTAWWTGVRLADVLAAAGLRGEARHIGFEAPDVSQLASPPQPYGASIPAGKALRPEVLLAWEMNGAPLPAVHGGPVRLVVPGYIGARSVKWVRRITALAAPSPNYFQATAYRLLPPHADPAAAGPGDGISLGPIALNCAILSPADGDSVPPGPAVMRGYALAGEDREVARVDVSADGGRSWQQADLGGQPGRYAWQLWRAAVSIPAGGTAEIVARAWDDTGALQPESARSLWNPKGYANNSWPRARLRVQPRQFSRIDRPEGSPG